MPTESGSSAFRFEKAPVQRYEENAQYVESTLDVRSEILRTGGPRDRMIKILAQAEVPTEEIARYSAAVEEFFARPTRLEKGRPDTGFSFSFNRYYFSPEISVQSNVSFPDISRIFKLKPKLASVEAHAEPVREITLDPQTVYETFLHSQKDVSTSSKPFVEELVAINRWTYAVHEALHINQAISIGDNLNRVIEASGAPEIFNPEKIAQIVNHRTDPSFDVSPSMEEAVAKLKTSPLVSDRLAKGQSSALLFGNVEASMDSLADFALKDSIRERPRFVAWLHNEILTRVIFLEQIKKDLTESKKDYPNELFLAMHKARAETTFTLEMLMRPYFAAFDSSAEARAYLDAAEKRDKPTGKTLNVTAVEHASVDPATITNLISDVTLLMTEEPDVDAYSVAKFPNGREAFYFRGGSRRPFCMEGVKLTVDIVRAAQEKGWTHKQITSFFSYLQDGLEPGDEGMLDVLAKNLKTELTLSVPVSDLELLFGMKENLGLDSLRIDYPRKAIVRKAILQMMLQDQPKAAQALIQPMFFQLPTSYAKNDVVIMTGILKVDEAMDWTTKPIPWDEVEKNTALGIVDLDVPALSEPQRGRLKVAYQDVEKAYEIWKKHTDQDGLHIDGDGYEKAKVRFFEFLVVLRKEQKGV